MDRVEVLVGDVVWYRQQECEVIIAYKEGHNGVHSSGENTYLLIHSLKYPWRKWRVHRHNVMWLRHARVAQG